MSHIFLDRNGSQHQKPSGREVLTRASTDALIIKNGQILLIKEQGLNLWEMPGGGVENGESLEDSLKREVLEETGYRVSKVLASITQRKTNYYSIKLDQYFNSITNFFAVEISNDEPIKPTSTTNELKWMDLKTLDLETIKPFHRDVIVNYLRGINE